MISEVDPLISCLPVGFAVRGHSSSKVILNTPIPTAHALSRPLPWHFGWLQHDHAHGQQTHDFPVRFLARAQPRSQPTCSLTASLPHRRASGDRARTLAHEVDRDPPRRALAQPLLHGQEGVLSNRLTVVYAQQRKVIRVFRVTCEDWNEVKAERA